MKNKLINSPKWWKTGIIFIMLFSSVALTGCTAKNLETSAQEPGQVQEQVELTKEPTTEPAKEPTKEPVTDNQNTGIDQGAVDEDMNQYKNMTQLTTLIELSRDDLIKKVNDKYTKVDEGGIEFTKPEIRVWFDENNKVNQIFTTSTEIDFNGVKIGDDIKSFQKVFGEMTKDNTGEAHFKSGDLFISVYYDSETGISYSVYLLTEDF